jgi:hypothetical protein
VNVLFVPPRAHAAAVQIASIFEALITVLLVVLFMVFGAYAWRLVNRAQSLLQTFSLQIQKQDKYGSSVAELAISKGRRMKMRVECIMVVVFLTFIFRAVFSCMYAYSFVDVDRRQECDLCGECQSLVLIVHIWFDCNPQVQIIARILSGPVALMLVLSTMMGQKEKELLWIRKPLLSNNSNSVSAVVFS